MAIKPKTAAEAKAFTDKAEKELLLLANAFSRADWVKSTHITDDTEAIAAEANQRFTDAAVAAAKKAATFDGVKTDPETARKLKLLKVALVTPAPTGSKESAEVTRLLASLEGAYGKGKYTRKTKDGKEETLDLGELSNILVTSRDPKEMEEAWAGWHSIARPMKKDFLRFVELQNKGARQLGFKDTGALWRSKYDMPPDAFAKEVDRLWEQVKPLYLSLHAYVRNRLRQTYGPTSFRRRVRSPHTSSATCGRSSGGTSSPSWLRRRTPASISPRVSRRRRSTSWRWSATASASSPPSASTPSRRPSGSGRSS
jgi:peptidyl-dipeptidase A